MLKRDHVVLMVSSSLSYRSGSNFFHHQDDENTHMFIPRKQCYFCAKSTLKVYPLLFIFSKLLDISNDACKIAC